MTSPPLTPTSPPTLNVFAYLWQMLSHRRYLPLLCRKFVREFTRQTVLGWWWLLVRAVLPTLGMIVILQNFEQLQPAEVPYGLHLAGGMVLWTMLSTGFFRGLRGLSQNRRLLMFHQFPRMLAVMAGMTVPVVFVGVFAAVLCGILIFYWIDTGVLYLKFEWSLLIAPLLMILTYLLITGICAVLAVIFLMARDVRFMMPLVGQMWFLLTPMIYPLSFIEEPWRTVMLYVNPMAAIIETFRWSLFGSEPVSTGPILVAVVISLGIFLMGTWFVMRSEILMEDIS